MQILVVDNDRDTSLSLVRLLRQLGYAAEGCTESSEALEMIERLRPAVIMLDLAMPTITGLDIAEELQHNPDLRPRLLIAVTGYESAELRAKTRALGFDHYFLKPLELPRLRGVIETAAAPCDVKK